jgi:hypothetical protein
VLVGLGNRREPADIAEQDGHPALFAAEYEFLGRTRKLFYERRGQVEAEGGANLLALLLFLEIIYEGECEIDKQARHQRIGKVERQIVL